MITNYCSSSYNRMYTDNYHSIKMKLGPFWPVPLSELRDDSATAKIDDAFFLRQTSKPKNWLIYHLRVVEFMKRRLSAIFVNSLLDTFLKKL